MNAKHRKIEDIFSAKTDSDNKHRLNTCLKPVGIDVLRKIERGCSLETLEDLLSKDFDVYKYQTQITIHGLFPETETRRIGGYYVNLVQNKNKSIGIRYTAIDHEKKARLFRMLNTLKMYNICENSNAFYIYYCKEILRENAKEEIEAMKQKAENIDRSLFFGNVDCFLAKDVFGRVFVYLIVNIGCFYESNFTRLFETLSGLSFEDGQKKIEQIEEDDRKRLAEYNAKWDQIRKEHEKKQAELNERKRAFYLENKPEGFVKVSNYAAKPGDVLAVVSDYEGKIYMEYRGFAKSFGKLTKYPCDENGNRTGKGFEVLKNSFNGYMKVA